MVSIKTMNCKWWNHRFIFVFYACEENCVCKFSHMCVSQVFVSLWLYICLCESSPVLWLFRPCPSCCVVKHWSVSLSAHYSPLSSIAPICLAALRHHPSPHSLYEYWSTPHTTLPFFCTCSYSLAFSRSPCLSFWFWRSHVSVSVMFCSYKYFLSVLLSLPLPLYFCKCISSALQGGESCCCTPLCPIVVSCLICSTLLDSIISKRLTHE